MTGLCRSGKSGSYLTEQAAQDALDRIREDNDVANTGRKVPVRVYECEFCSEWHLTSKPKTKGGGRG